MSRTGQGQSGQAVTEAILIIITFLGVTFAVTNYFREQEVLRSLISTPWQSLAGMIQNGSWGAPSRTNILHPNSHDRHISIRGESAR